MELPEAGSKLRLVLVSISDHPLDSLFYSQIRICQSGIWLYRHLLGLPNVRTRTVSFVGSRNIHLNDEIWLPDIFEYFCTLPYGT